MAYKPSWQSRWPPARHRFWPTRPKHSTVESFNGRFRDECLNEHLFHHLDEARCFVEAWRIDYNVERPHTALGGLAPVAYRRVHVLLRREGWAINLKKTYRIYRELGMQLRTKTPKRRVNAKLREDRAEAVGPNDVLAMDFVHDQLATGRKIWVLTVVDTWSRYVPVLDPQFSYRGEEVVATLERVCRRIGYSKASLSSGSASPSVKFLRVQLPSAGKSSPCSSRRRAAARRKRDCLTPQRIGQWGREWPNTALVTAARPEVRF